MQVTIEGILHDGDGFGRDPNGAAWRVPGALPGDVVEVQGTTKPGLSVATQVTRVSESPQRIAPFCPVVRCGGCALRELSPEGSAAAKERVVSHALHVASVRPIITHPDLGYRHRVRLHARGRTIGYHAQSSKEIAPLSQCAVLIPAFFTRLLKLVRRLDVRGEIEAVYSPVGDRLAVEVVLDKGADAKAAHALFRSVVAEGLCEGALVVEPNGTSRRHGDPHVLLHHPTHPDAKFFIEPGVFSQAHLALNAALVRYVAEQVATGVRVLELHAGSGNLTLALDARVTATEWDEQAVMCLRRNVESHRSQAAVEALGDLAAWQKHGSACDVLLLDPPRIGAKQTCAAIAAAPHSVRRIVYVSCDPGSLARDIALLTPFRLISAQPFDMFPGTPHVETVAVLDRVAD